LKVGICRLELRIPFSHSLKEKRGIVKRLMTRVQQRFPVSIAEVECQDVWQKAVLGMAVVGTGTPFVQGVIEKAINFLENNFDGEIMVTRTEVINV